MGLLNRKYPECQSRQTRDCNIFLFTPHNAMFFAGTSIPQQKVSAWRNVYVYAPEKKFVWSSHTQWECRSFHILFSLSADNGKKREKKFWLKKEAKIDPCRLFSEWCKVQHDNGGNHESRVETRSIKKVELKLGQVFSLAEFRLPHTWFSSVGRSWT